MARSCDEPEILGFQRRFHVPRVANEEAIVSPAARKNKKKKLGASAANTGFYRWLQEADPTKRVNLYDHRDQRESCPMPQQASSDTMGNKKRKRVGPASSGSTSSSLKKKEKEEPEEKPEEKKKDSPPAGGPCDLEPRSPRSRKTKSVTHAEQDRRARALQAVADARLREQNRREAAELQQLRVELFAVAQSNADFERRQEEAEKNRHAEMHEAHQTGTREIIERQIAADREFCELQRKQRDENERRRGTRLARPSRLRTDMWLPCAPSGAALNS